MRRYRLGPVGTWQRPDLRVALAQHDMRRVFLILQHCGVSQREIAAATGMNQSEVSEVICRRRLVVSYAVLRRLADGFNVPRGWLGLTYDRETRRLLDNADKRPHGGE